MKFCTKIAVILPCYLQTFQNFWATEVDVMDKQLLYLRRIWADFSYCNCPKVWMAQLSVGVHFIQNWTSSEIICYVASLSSENIGCILQKWFHISLENHDSQNLTCLAWTTTSDWISSELIPHVALYFSWVHRLWPAEMSSHITATDMVSPIPATAQIAKFMGPTWGPPGSCQPQMGPMLAPWTLLSGRKHVNGSYIWECQYCVC